MESVAGVLGRLLHQLGLDEQMAGWRAVQEWADLVGERVARHTRAVAFRDGTLYVEVEGSAWMHELQFLSRDLVRRVNERLGRATVRDIRFAIPRGGALRPPAKKETTR